VHVDCVHCCCSHANIWHHLLDQRKPIEAVNLVSHSPGELLSNQCVHVYVFTQVIEGGNYDVDVLISARQGTLYKEQKKQYDQHTWTPDEDGEIRFCFSNEFSTITHKVVYFDFQAGDDDPLRQPSGNPLTAMTQVHILCIHISHTSSSLYSLVLSLSCSVPLERSAIC